MVKAAAIGHTSERIRLKDTTCPLIRLDQARRRGDKRVSFSISAFLHIVIFVSIGASFIKPPQFGVDRGYGSIEVNLVAAPVEPVVAVPVETPVVAPSEFVQKEASQPVVKKEEVSAPTKGKDAVTARSTGGAVTEAKPDYLKNPAPAYPETARRRGWEGTVMLSVSVGKDGSALSVTIEKGSGHTVLDEAAVKAVKAWKFQPARFGGVPVASTARVPVRFRLDGST